MCVARVLLRQGLFQGGCWHEACLYVSGPEWAGTCLAKARIVPGGLLARALLRQELYQEGCWHEARWAVCPRTGRACSTWNSLRAWICRPQGIPPLHPLLPPPIGAPTRSRRPRLSRPVRHLSPSSPPPPPYIGVGRSGVECRGTDTPCFTWSGVGGGWRRGVLVQWVSDLARFLLSVATPPLTIYPPPTPLLVPPPGPSPLICAPSSLARGLCST